MQERAPKAKGREAEELLTPFRLPVTSSRCHLSGMKRRGSGKLAALLPLVYIDRRTKFWSERNIKNNY
jgi:hypothetical protein